MNNISFTNLIKPSKKIVGSGFAGSINCTYDHLVNTFGEPMIPTDGYKTSAEWHIEVRRNDKLLGVVSIYDYKQHNNYTKDGTETEDITEWHVGGRDSFVTGEVMAFVNHPHMLRYNKHHRDAQAHV